MRSDGSDSRRWVISMTAVRVLGVAAPCMCIVAQQDPVRLKSVQPPQRCCTDGRIPSVVPEDRCIEALDVPCGLTAQNGSLVIPFFDQHRLMPGGVTGRRHDPDGRRDLIVTFDLRQVDLGRERPFVNGVVRCSGGVGFGPLHEHLGVTEPVVLSAVIEVQV